jgi:hypothetical protein
MKNYSNLLLNLILTSNSMAKEGHELIDLRADGIFRQSRPELCLETILKNIKFCINLENKDISEE